MSGTFVSCKNGTITLSHGNKANTDHAVEPMATVTLNGDPSALTDLQAGDKVNLSGDPATSVSATR